MVSAMDGDGGVQGCLLGFFDWVVNQGEWTSCQTRRWLSLAAMERLGIAE